MHRVLLMFTEIFSLAFRACIAKRAKELDELDVRYDHPNGKTLGKDSEGKT